MNRRNAILALSGAMATSALILPRKGLAQTQTVPTLDHSQYKTATLMIGTLSKELSMLAVQRASHPRIKQFAQFEIDEQITVAQVLTDLDNPPPAKLDQPHAAVLTQLQGVSDKAFDMAYIQDEITGHTELLDTQQSFLNSRPSDMDFRHIAMLARTVIQMHLTMLQDLRNTLQA